MSDILNASGLAGDCCSQSKKNFKKQYSMVNNLTIWSFGFDLIQQWMLGILWCIWNTYTTSKKDIYRKRNINNMMKISFIIFLSKILPWPFQILQGNIFPVVIRNDFSNQA